MNARPPLSLLLGTLTCLLAACSLPPEESVRVNHDIDIGPLEPPGPAGWTFEVRRGDTRERVLLVCGRPASTLGADLWIYGSGVIPRQGPLDTLVVAFAADRVQGFRLVNGEALRATLAQLPRVGPGGRELSPAIGR